MSRVGKLPVPIPENVKVSIADRNVTVEGPRGTMSQEFSNLVEVKSEDGVILVTRVNDSKRARAFHGLYRNLIRNMVTGVTTGFSRTLLINGVGYRAELRENTLVLNLGFSTPIEYPVPEGLTITTEGPNKFTVSGNSKQEVGKAASELRSLRPPEPYKGKGIKYEEERIVRKVGKAGIK
ncbi:MAG: 50S ribosomal protein L6 [Spirochaetes bacterium]|jgi:large subunit ribosomal protein L6|nr:50S ribosomal protein L6 [Spirochaetota bacterium]